MLLFEPLYYCVFYVANSIQICKVLLQLVSIRSHVLGPVVVSNHLLTRNGLERQRQPFKCLLILRAHKGYKSDTNLSVVVYTNRRHRNAIASNVWQAVEFPLFLVHPNPARRTLRIAIEPKLGHLLIGPCRGLTSVSLATHFTNLAAAWLEHFKSKDSVDPSAVTLSISHFLFPEIGRS